MKISRFLSLAVCSFVACSSMTFAEMPPAPFPENSFEFSEAYNTLLPIDEAKREAILELLNINHQKEKFNEEFSKAMKLARKKYPKMPNILWETIEESINVDDFLESLVPVYDKYFSHEEILELIAFARSPVGQKLAELQPQIEKDTKSAAVSFVKDCIKNLIDALRAADNS